MDMFSVEYAPRLYNSSDSGFSSIVRDKPIFSSERMLHKDYYRRSSAKKKKKSGRGSQGAWRQDELIGGKPPVVK
jgi:hypothetical protein